MSVVGKGPGNGPGSGFQLDQAGGSGWGKGSESVSGYRLENDPRSGSPFELNHAFG